MKHKKENGCKRRKLNSLSKNSCNISSNVSSKGSSNFSSKINSRRKLSLEKKLAWVRNELSAIGPIDKSKILAGKEKPPVWEKLSSEVSVYNSKPHRHTIGIKLFVALLLITVIFSAVMSINHQNPLSVIEITNQLKNLFDKTDTLTGAEVISLPATETAETIPKAPEEPITNETVSMNETISEPKEIKEPEITEPIKTTEYPKSDKDKNNLIATGSPLVSTGTTSAGNAYYIITNTTGTYNSYNCNTPAGAHTSGTKDDGMHQTTLGFPFPYFNQVKSATAPIYMDTNGRLSWSDTTSDFGGSDAEMQTEQNIAVIWQDLGSDAYNNESICTNQGTAPNRYAVFRWNSTYYTNAGTVQAEAILFENGTIHMQYGSIADHTDADPTIIGVSLGDNANYNFTSNLSVNSSVITNNSLYIYSKNLPPITTSVILNSTDVTSNDTNTNITAYTTTSDANGDTIKVIYNWLRNSTYIAVLNMPFEGVNNTASDNAWDYSGSNNNGTEYNGVLWNYSGGHDGRGAYEFDGSNDYISIPNDVTLNLSRSAFTIAMWIKPANLTNWQYIIGSTYNGDSFRMPPAFALNEDDLSIRWTVNDAGGQRALAADSISTGKWSHIAATYDGTNVKLYVNGSLIDTQAASTPDSTSQPIAIGRRGDIADDTALVFNGTIDDVFIFNISLSDKQIQALSENKTSIMVSDETKKSQIWQVAATANDGSSNSYTNLSNNITIGNVKPTLDSLILNSTNMLTNDTYVNLTAYTTTSDNDSDSVKVIYNWLKNKTSITILNMPFEKVTGSAVNATKDYSTFSNNGTERNGVLWNSTGGFDGKGAYEYDGTNDIIDVGKSSRYISTINQTFTAAMWFKPNYISENTLTQNLIAPMEAVTTASFRLGTGDTNRLTYYAQAVATRKDITTTLIVGKWHHVALVFNGSAFLPYFNGTLQTGAILTEQLDAGSSDYNTYISSMRATWTFFNGTIDEVLIFNRSLSAEEIKILYENKTNILASGETIENETWSVQATPNDGTEDGITNTSNNITIVASNKPPVIVSLILNTTNVASNNTDVNLTAYATTSDPNNDNVKVIYNWLLNGTSIALLNMPFEGGSNSTFTKDYAYWSNNGTVSKSVWNSTGGIDGKGAYEFNGSGGITIPNNLPIRPAANDFTVVGGLKINDLSSLYGTVFGYGSPGIGVAEGFILQKHGGSLRIYSRTNNTGEQSVALTGTYAINTWYYTALTRTGTNFTGWINGTKRASSTATGSMNESGGWGIGVDSQGNNMYFNGTVDDVIVFNRSLSEEEIKTLYENKTNFLASGETIENETWSVQVTPNDGTEDGITNTSNNVTIVASNKPPVITSLLLNTTNIASNDTNVNLTAYATTSDPNNDNVKVIYNWLLNGTSIAVLNMPFERINASTTYDNAWDYSGYRNNGTVSGATWNSTGGFDGKGAYQFEGIDTSYDRITIPLNNTYTIDRIPFTVMAWFKHTNAGKQSGDTIVSQGTQGNCQGAFSLSLRNPADGRVLFSANNATSTGCIGLTSSTSTTYFQNNTWYHAAGVFNGSHLLLYVNGTFEASTAVTTDKRPQSSNEPTYIGWGHSTFHWNGSVDEVLVFNRSLSAEEIKTLYWNRTDILASGETVGNDNWSVQVTPNDGTEDGITNTSNSVIILENTLPGVPSLIYPANNSNITNRTSPFIWNNSVDADGNNVTYNIVIDDNPTFNNPEVNITNIGQTTNINTTYNIATELNIDTRYYWMVRANDSTSYGEYSPMFNFTLQSYLALTATVSSVNFGSHQPGESNNTTTNNPPPFKVENVGNIFANVTITGTRYFASGDFPSNSFQYNISESEAGAYDLTNSTKRWTNVTSTSSIVDVAFFDWHTIYDDFLMHLLITVPEDESPGELSSTITFTGNS